MVYFAIAFVSKELVEVELFARIHTFAVLLLVEFEFGDLQAGWCGDVELVDEAIFDLLVVGGIFVLAFYDIASLAEVFGEVAGCFYADACR